MVRSKLELQRYFCKIQVDRFHMGETRNGELKSGILPSLGCSDSQFLHEPEFMEGVSFDES